MRFIAEIHPQHTGNPAELLRLAEASALAGADIVKIQLYDNDFLGPDWDYLVVERSLFDDFVDLCRQFGVIPSASFFSPSRLEWGIEAGLSLFKVASRTVSENPKLVKEILQIKADVLVSMGMMARRDAELPFAEFENAKFLTCLSKYPARWVDFDFEEHFKFDSRVIGFSDHSIGFGALFFAVANGAQVVEKHVTFRPSRWRETERAHISSCTPEQMHSLLPELKRLSVISNLVR